MAVFHEIPIRSARNQLLGILFSPPPAAGKADLLTIAPTAPVHSYPLRDLPVMYRPGIKLGAGSVIFVLGAEPGNAVNYNLNNDKGVAISGVTTTMLLLESESDFQSFTDYFDLNRKGWEISTEGPPDASLQALKSALDALVDPQASLEEKLPGQFRRQWKSVVRFIIPASSAQDGTLFIEAEKQGLKANLAAPINIRTEIDADLEIGLVRLSDLTFPLATEIENQDKPHVKKRSGSINPEEQYAIQITDSQNGVDYKIVEIPDVSQQDESELNPLGAGTFSLLFPNDDPVFKVGYKNPESPSGDSGTNPTIKIEDSGSDVDINLDEENPRKLIITIPGVSVSADAVMEEWLSKPEADKGGFSLKLFLRERFSKESLSKTGPTGPGLLPIPPDAKPEKDARWAVGASRSVDENAPFQEEILKQRLILSVSLNNKVNFAFDPAVPEGGLAAGVFPAIILDNPQKGVEYELYALPLTAGFSFDEAGANYTPDGALAVGRDSLISDADLAPETRNAELRPVYVFNSDGKPGTKSSAGILEDSLLVLKAKIGNPSSGITPDEIWLDGHLTVLVKPGAGPDLEIVDPTAVPVRIRLSGAQSGVGYQLRDAVTRQKIGPVLLPKANRLAWEAHGEVFGMPIADDDIPRVGDFKIRMEGEGAENLPAPIELEFLLSSPEEGHTYEILAIKEYTGLDEILTKGVRITGGVPGIVTMPRVP